MAVLSFGNTSQPISVFWNHQEVLGSHSADVVESHAFVVFVNNVGRDFFSDNLVEDGNILDHSSLS